MPAADKTPQPSHRTAYEKGAMAALQKLGFINSVDPEDLPEFIAKTKRKQLQRLYQMNAASGFPAGGLIGEPENAYQGK